MTALKLCDCDINRKEIYRYLGYRGVSPSEEIHNLIEEVLSELLQVIQPKNLYKIYRCNIEKEQDSKVIITDLNEQDCMELCFCSRNLADNLRGCPFVIMMAATLGIEADKLMQRYEIMNMTKASILQACAAAGIEGYCNKLQEQLRQEALTHKMYLRPRFSAGYGDLPLAAQKDIFGALDCTKRLGLTLTESLLMYPTKSVTALIGVTPLEKSCHIAKCSQCDNIGCEFRNEDT